MVILAGGEYEHEVNILHMCITNALAYVDYKNM